MADGDSEAIRPSGHEAEWRAVLLGTHPGLRQARRVFKHIPSHPRCKACASPFGGAGGPLMWAIGRRRWPKNPKYCGQCFKQLAAMHGGAEIECTLLFADVRGSTTLAERMRPAEFTRLMDRFYAAAAAVLVDHDAIVDKFVGDEVMAIFIPAMAGERHAERAIAAARAVLRAVGYGGEHQWLPVGAGVHTGIAFVGSVGAGSNVDLTALGDPDNTAARLASAAGAGEILVSVAAVRAAEMDQSGLERRALELKGKHEVTEVVVVRG